MVLGKGARPLIGLRHRQLVAPAALDPTDTSSLRGTTRGGTAARPPALPSHGGPVFSTAVRPPCASPPDARVPHILLLLSNASGHGALPCPPPDGRHPALLPPAGRWCRRRRARRARRHVLHEAVVGPQLERELCAQAAGRREDATVSSPATEPGAARDAGVGLPPGDPLHLRHQRRPAAGHRPARSTLSAQAGGPGCYVRRRRGPGLTRAGGARLRRPARNQRDRRPRPPAPAAAARRLGGRAAAWLLVLQVGGHKLALATAAVPH